MKKQLIAALALTALILAPMTAAFAADPPTKTDDTTKRTHEMYVTVVAVDPDAKTLSFRGPDGNEKNGTVKGEAVNKLRDLRPGQQVTLVVQDPTAPGAGPSAGSAPGGTATADASMIITDIKLEKASGKKG